MKANKTYYSISEVSYILGIEQHTIRFWDSKISGLSKKSDKGKTRFFTQYQINKIEIIHKLLNNYSSLELANKIISKDKNIKFDLDLYDAKINHNDSIKTVKNVNIIKNTITNLKGLISSK
jgi:DNA-binding transcriptional MerR regulator